MSLENPRLYDKQAGILRLSLYTCAVGKEDRRNIRLFGVGYSA